MGRQVSHGRSVKVVVPASTVIVAGNFYTLDGVTGMAMFDVTTEVGETAEVVLEVDFCEYEVKQAAAAFAKGAKLQFAGGVFAALAGGSEIGTVTKAADGNGVFWFKRTKIN